MPSNKIVMCGCHIAGIESIKHILDNGITIDYFVILTPQQAIEYNISGYFDYTSMAQKYDIPIYYAKSYNLKAAADLEFFSQHKFDLMIQGGWQRLFPDEVLATLRIGAIGLHGSSEFLPRGRGRSPYNWSLIEGKKRFILHFFLIKPGIDDGDIFHYEHFEINDFDDINTMYYKGAILAKRAYVQYIPKLLNGDVRLIEQTGQPTYYPKRTPEDGKIDWNTMDVDQIYNSIRAQTKPYPGAFASFNGNRVSLWKAQVFDRVIKYDHAQYGEIVEHFDDRSILINCLGGLLLVTVYESSEKITTGSILV
ncbi:MAG: formyltransferase family protein [Sulfuricurvum sp.]|uniref:methionyl-tRNA formyltransferase n=1 Tax=Sulfuricurvum sp. TaxID=2025608 RepID=UPI002728B8BC|nr:formyltransferase family protein [Sulfuricurvum sp.]MDO9056592.1 formyltransferase family protein [Sulfuricurvum sp.]